MTTTNGAVPTSAPPAARPPRPNPLDPTQITFRGFLESFNPLQHLPVIGSLYRDATGESAPIAARLAVGAVTGGPIGFLTTAAGILAEETEMLSHLRDALGERGRAVANASWGETNGPEVCARAIRLYEGLAASGP